MSHDVEERAEEAGTLRWRFEKSLERVSDDIRRKIESDDARGRFVRLRIITSALPSIFAYFVEGLPWEDAAIDAILLSWLSEHRELDAGVAATQKIYAIVAALVAAVIDGKPLAEANAATSKLLSSLPDD